MRNTVSVSRSRDLDLGGGGEAEPGLERVAAVDERPGHILALLEGLEHEAWTAGGDIGDVLVRHAGSRHRA